MNYNPLVTVAIISIMICILILNYKISENYTRLNHIEQILKIEKTDD